MVPLGGEGGKALMKRAVESMEEAEEGLNVFFSSSPLDRDTEPSSPFQCVNPHTSEHTNSRSNILTGALSYSRFVGGVLP